MVSSGSQTRGSVHRERSLAFMVSLGGMIFCGDFLYRCSSMCTICVSGAKAKDWTRVAVPPSVVAELLLDRVLSLFVTVGMRLPYLLLVGATDASTVYGHGATVANLGSSEIDLIARLACKGGAHVQPGDGPDLSDELLARLGPLYNVGLTLKDFTVVLCVKVDSPGHINLEEANALVGYIR